MNNYVRLAMHSLAAATRPRLLDTDSKLFVFETSCYAVRSVGDIALNPSLRKISVNTV